MIGFILALLYFAAIYFLGQPTTAPEGFLSATNFLFWWYIVTTAIIGAIILLVGLGSSGLTAHFADNKLLGFLIGSLGGAATIVILVLFAISSAISIIGVYFLHHSLIITATGIAECNTVELIIGIVLLVVGLFRGN